MSYNATAIRLSICLRTNGFSFSLIDGNRTLCLQDQEDLSMALPLGQLAEQVKSSFAKRGITPLDLSGMRLVVPSRNFVWIPEHLFEVSRRQQYLDTVVDTGSSQGEIFHVFNKSLKAYHVFTADAKVVTAFKLALPGVDVHSQHSVLVVEELMNRSQSHPVILLHLDSGRADLDAFYAGQLMISVSRPVDSVDDAIFFALGVIKQLHLETPDMELTLSGEVDRQSFAQMRPFFPRVTLFTGVPVYHPDPALPPVPTYKYPLLFNAPNA